MDLRVSMLPWLILATAACADKSGAPSRIGDRYDRMRRPDARPADVEAAEPADDLGPGAVDFAARLPTPAAVDDFERSLSENERAVHRRELEAAVDELPPRHDR
jgi:hypothetical protein